MLSNRLLLALEVAIEYWLALNSSMEAKNVDQDHHVDGSQEALIHEALRREMEQQKGCVWQFIIDRCATLMLFVYSRLVRDKFAVGDLADAVRVNLVTLLRTFQGATLPKRSVAMLSDVYQ